MRARRAHVAAYESNDVIVQKAHTIVIAPVLGIDVIGLV